MTAQHDDTQRPAAGSPPPLPPARRSPRATLAAPPAGLVVSVPPGRTWLALVEKGQGRVALS